MSAFKSRTTPLMAIGICMTLLACNVSVMASGDEPCDQPSDKAVVELSFDGLGEPEFNLTLFSQEPTPGQDTPLGEGQDDPEDAAAASNPLSSTSNLDFRVDYFGLGSKDRYDFNIRGGTMLHPRVKLAFEVHYWSTNITGTTNDNWERLVLRPIYFVKDAKLNETWKMRIATGVEFSFDADNADEGIGSGSDQIAPLLGFAFNNSESKLTLIPFVQQFLSIDGPNVNITAFRLIALQPLPDAMWLRLDAKLPFDWTHDTVPASFEVELGKMLGGWGVFGTGFFGIGGDRLYDWGVGVGLRFTF